MAQQAPPARSEHASTGYSRDDPYIICTKNHAADHERYSRCDLKGEWHEGHQN